MHTELRFAHRLLLTLVLMSLFAELKSRCEIHDAVHVHPLSMGQEKLVVHMEAGSGYIN